MSLRSPAAAEIALTLALPHQNGEGIFESHIALARFAGEGRGEGSVLTRRWISKNGIKKAAPASAKGSSRCAHAVRAEVELNLQGRLEWNDGPGQYYLRVAIPSL